MILVVKTDLNMGKGKIAAHCSHAAVTLYDMIIHEQNLWGEKWRLMLKKWVEFGAKKIVLRVDNESKL